MKEVRFYPTCHNRLGFLEDATRIMLELIGAYVDRRRGENAPYLPYCGERATLSILAGAVWRSDPDNFVAEEYRHNKRRGAKPYRGRKDIWFRASGQQCCGEAKYRWVSLAKPNVNSDRDVLLDEANTCADQNPADVGSDKPSDIAIGIYFLVPSVRRTDTSDDRGKKLTREKLTKYRDSLGHDLDRWCEDNKCHVLWAEYSSDALLEKPHPDHQEVTPTIHTFMCTAEKSVE